MRYNHKQAVLFSAYFSRFYNKFWGEKKRDSKISIFRVKKEHKIQKSDIISLPTKNKGF